MPKDVPAAPLVRRLAIRNRKGLHARASARFVSTVEAHGARAVVRFDGIEAPGDSIMGLMTLVAAQGSEIEVETSGPEAEALMEALSSLLADRFGEPD